MKSLKCFKIITICSIASLVLTLTPISASAYVSNYENENNNTSATANITQDDYNNFGTIASASDIDYWKVTMPTNGLGAIWLGNIPEGCDYDIYVTDSDSEGFLAYSSQPSNSQEYCRVRFYANVPVYVAVISNGGYSTSGQYLLRFKNYPLGNGGVFTYRYSDFESGDSLDTTDTAQSATTMQNYGYSCVSYINNSAYAVNSVLDDCQFVLIRGHGGPGRMKLKNSKIFANNHTGMPSSSYALSDFPTAGLSEIQLIIFGGCSTGAEDEETDYGNLVDMALSKKARLALGFTETTYAPASSLYMNYLTSSLRGRSVEDAFSHADSWAENKGDYYYPMINCKYWGNSRIECVNFA